MRILRLYIIGKKLNDILKKLLKAIALSIIRLLKKKKTIDYKNDALERAKEYSPYNENGRSIREKYPHDEKSFGKIKDKEDYFNVRLQQEISVKSGDWYNAEPVSKKQKAFYEKYPTSKERRQHSDEFLNIVLDDLGMPKTKENREAIYYHVYID